MNPLSNEQLVIRPKRSRKTKSLVLSFYCVLSLIVMSLVFYAGLSVGSGEQSRSAKKLEVLQKKFTKLSDKHSSLLEQEAKLTQTQNVQQAAYVELEKNYELVDQRNEFLNRRVNFYRSILSPDDGVSGVRIHDVSLIEEGDSIYFEVVLIQSINHSSRASAKVFVELFETKQSRQPIAAWKTENHNFQFKFSETVRGSLESEKELDGMFLKIKVLPNGDSAKQLVEWHGV